MSRLVKLVLCENLRFFLYEFNAILAIMSLTINHVWPNVLIIFFSPSKFVKPFIKLAILSP
jgi:hypothetical protein